jgi:uncharacterized RmlC-like cupin family protein
VFLNQEAAMDVLQARYQNLVPYQSQHANNGIPSEVLEYLAATRVYPVVSPLGLVGRNALAPLRGGPGLCLTIAECIPQDGPVAHDHTGTLETFFCVDGQFEVSWGNRLEQAIVLNPGDMCSVPPRVYRSFKNLAGHDARLLVLIQGDRQMSDKIEMPKYLGGEIASKYGERVIELLAGINMRFQGEEDPEFPLEKMLSRVVRSDTAHVEKLAHGILHHYMDPSGARSPVACWPGLELSVLSAQMECQIAGQNDRSDWIFNVGKEPCSVQWQGQKMTLGFLDVIRADEGVDWVAKPLGSSSSRLLIARQGRETIVH